MRPTRRAMLKLGAGTVAGLIAGPGASASQSDAAGHKPSPRLQPASPEWTKDLIIYEIATKGFTSPAGPESGTFRSLAGRLAYLQELGIRGIWLTGYARCDAHHFYNIWTQYAVIEPEKLDPSLGTETDFKDFIAEAHRRGIKVFLDVITHGLMQGSPMVKAHPEWFRGESWGMADFDWGGGHTDLDDWWVKIWTDYVTQFQVDGYRLDVAIYRPDLWARIRQNAAAAGHPIVIFEEDDGATPGVTDFTQSENAFSSDGDPQASALKEILAQDVPRFFDRKFGKSGHYRVEIQYADDGSRAHGSTDGEGELRVHLDGLKEDKAPRRWRVNFLPMPDGVPDVRLTVENAQTRPIENIVVTDDVGGRWELHPVDGRYLVLEGQEFFAPEGPTGKPSLLVYLATLGHGWPTVQLSCHDNGWDGFPLDRNPCVAQGSRALFGYACLFTPMIPMFFSGEEFNASFRPLTWVSPHLYGGKDAGKGRWLYGAMLDWADLDQPEHRAMFEDVKKMIAVRRREAEVVAVTLEQIKPNLLAVPCEHDIAVPVPYVRWNRQAAIIIAANRSTTQDARLKLLIPLTEIGSAGHASYRVSNLWPGGESKLCGEAELRAYDCTVKRDRMAGGGLLVLKIEPV